jgi:hypothetical protein
MPGRTAGAICGIQLFHAFVAPLIYLRVGLSVTIADAKASHSVAGWKRPDPPLTKRELITHAY